MSEKSYEQEARDDAHRLIGEMEEKIFENFLDQGEITTNLCDYQLDRHYDADTWFRENVVDCYYNIDADEAHEIMVELHDHKAEPETTANYAEGLAHQAAETYGNAVLSFWEKFVNVVNDDNTATALYNAYTELDDVDDPEFVKDIKDTLHDKIKTHLMVLKSDLDHY